MIKNEIEIMFTHYLILYIYFIYLRLKYAEIVYRLKSTITINNFCYVLSYLGLKNLS